MTDRQVKRTAIDRSGGHDKMSLWGPVTGGSTGRTPQHGRQQGTTFQTPQPPTISVDSISLFSIGALGALINGLEDEYHGTIILLPLPLPFFVQFCYSLSLSLQRYAVQL